MPDAFIYDHVRTPRGRGKPDGALHSVTPMQLTVQTLAALRRRNSLDTALVDDVVLGCVSPVGEQGSNIARIAALVAGFDERVPGKQLNRFCASGLEAVNTAAAQIMSGQADLVIGGGIESMSRVPIGADGGAWTSDPAVAYATYFVPQGIGADLIATIDGLSRDALDTYAVSSQQRAARAWAEGRFGSSIIPVRDVIGEIVLERDEYMRPQTILSDLAALRPAFAVAGEQGGFDAVAIQRYPHVERIRHVHTAGNSSGIVDGAAAVLIGTREMSSRMGNKPRARIVGFSSVGSEPTIMLTGPAAATRKVLARAGMKLQDIDLFEVNEAFASVALRFIRELELDPLLVNVNGGAIAMGHPLGATGTMLLGTALDELERQDLSTALVTLCVGAGMGTATIIERV
jgi:acetyl-CoA C-acetyltransferase